MTRKLIFILNVDSKSALVVGKNTLLKKRASAFQGTELAGILRADNVVKIVVTGFTACAFVRQTIFDGVAKGFRPIAVKEARCDRVPGEIVWNLFDIDAQFGDALSLESILNEFTNIKS